MKIKLNTFLFVILIYFFSNITFAQLPITIKYNWKPLFTVDEYLITPPMIPRSNYTGYTYFVWGIPYIEYNPKLLEFYKVTQAAMVFIRVHEHGHATMKITNEVKCDCWAAMQLESAGDGKILDDAIYYYRNILGSKSGDAFHTDGKGVAETIERCRTLINGSSPFRVGKKTKKSLVINRLVK